MYDYVYYYHYYYFFTCTLVVMHMLSVLELGLSMQGFNSQQRLRANIFIIIYVKFNLSMCSLIAKHSHMDCESPVPDAPWL